MVKPWPRLLQLATETEAPTDEHLACAVLAGNMGALEELFRRYEPPVVRYLQRLVRDEEAALDLFQDAFFRAYVNLRSYDPRRPFRPWLYRIATNLGLDWLRRRVKALPAADQAHEPPSIAAILAAREVARRVEQAVVELSDDHRSVFLLRHYQGLSYAEIAEITASPEGTVRSRMHYALRILREKLRFLVEEETP